MQTKIYECISRIGDVIIANKDFLTDLDREIGDADHGINMARGFTEVLAAVPKDNENIGEVLKKTGMTLLAKVGGASGPLYGTAYMQAGKVCAGKTALAPEDGKAIFEAVIAGIQKRGKAVRGEKTMLDAIIPASEAYAAAVDSGASVGEALDAMCKAAEDGVEFTKTSAATKGRASYLGGRSIGHQDPGATSATYTMEAIRDYLKG